MTIVQPIQIQVAQNVFEAWDKIGVTGRAEKLEKLLRLFLMSNAIWHNGKLITRSEKLLKLV